MDQPAGKPICQVSEKGIHRRCGSGVEVGQTPSGTACSHRSSARSLVQKCTAGVVATRDWRPSECQATRATHQVVDHCSPCRSWKCGFTNFSDSDGIAYISIAGCPLNLVTYSYACIARLHDYVAVAHDRPGAYLLYLASPLPPWTLKVALGWPCTIPILM